MRPCSTRTLAIVHPLYAPYLRDLPNAISATASDSSRAQHQGGRRTGGRYGHASAGAETRREFVVVARACAVGAYVGRGGRSGSLALVERRDWFAGGGRAEEPRYCRGDNFEHHKLQVIAHAKTAG